MVGIRLFPFEMASFQVRLMLVLGSVGILRKSHGTSRFQINHHVFVWEFWGWNHQSHPTGRQRTNNHPKSLPNLNLTFTWETFKPNKPNLTFIYILLSGKDNKNLVAGWKKNIRNPWLLEPWPWMSHNYPKNFQMWMLHTRFTKHPHKR